MNRPDRSGDLLPLVDYLDLDGDAPRLMVNECDACAAQYVDRRNACASCFGTSFRKVPLPPDGRIVAFTVVHVAAPGLPVPYLAAIIDCGGTWVRANLVNTEPDPDAVRLGQPVRLATYNFAQDRNGATAVGFGFEPVLQEV